MAVLNGVKYQEIVVSGSRENDELFWLAGGNEQSLGLRQRCVCVQVATGHKNSAASVVNVLNGAQLVRPETQPTLRRSAVRGDHGSRADAQAIG